MDEKADADFNLVFQAIKAVRSLAVQYNLQKDVDSTLFLIVPFLHPVLTAGMQFTSSPLPTRKPQYFL